MERVIQGTASYFSFYCGGCDHTWTVTESPALPIVPASGSTPAAPKRKPPSR